MTHTSKKKTTPTLTEGFNFVTFIPRTGGKLESGHQSFIAIGQNAGEPLGTAKKLRAVEGYYHPEGFDSDPPKGHIAISQLVPSVKGEGIFDFYKLDLEHEHRGERTFGETLKAHNPFWFVNAPPIPLGHDYVRNENGIYELPVRNKSEERYRHLIIGDDGGSPVLKEVKVTPDVPSINTDYILGDPTLQF